MTLATGWDDSTTTDDSLLRTFVHAWADSQAEALGALGGTVRDEPGYAFVDHPRPAGYYAGVTPLVPPPVDGGWDALLDEVEPRILPGAGGFFLWSAFPTPDLRRRGWVLEGHPPLLVRPAGLPLPPAADGLDVRRVADGAGVADWQATVRAGYSAPGLDLFDPGILGSRLRMWTAYADGRPVGAAASFVAPAMHVAAMGVVLPAYRGRGIWRHLLRVRLEDAAGLPSAALFSDDARPGAQHFGHLPLLRFTLWRKPRP